MVLSKKSWHYWFYNQIFSRTPSNLCPYFWKTLLSVAIFPVAFVLSIPWWIVAIIRKDPIEEIRECAGFGFAIWIALGLVLSMIGMFFTKNQGITAAGWAGWMIVFLLLMFAIGDYIDSKAVVKNSFVGKYVQAKKDKLCPRIEWKENLKEAQHE